MLRADHRLSHWTDEGLAQSLEEGKHEQVPGLDLSKGKEQGEAKGED